MARKKVPTITTLCEHCGSDVTIKATPRWHKCPVCGMYFKPCAMCDCENINCMCECDLDLADKPKVTIGSHVIEEIVMNGDYIDIIFDWEIDPKKTDGESYRIHVAYKTEDGSFHFYEEWFDLNLRLINFVECHDHINGHDAMLVMRRLKKIAKKIS